MTTFLSPTQHRCIALVAKGAPSKHIARELGISNDTVKKHLQLARLKLGAKNAAELVSKAHQEGLLP